MQKKYTEHLTLEEEQEVIGARKEYARLNEALSTKTHQFNEAQKNLTTKNDTFISIQTKYNETKLEYENLLTSEKLTDETKLKLNGTLKNLEAELNESQAASQKAVSDYEQKRQALEKTTNDANSKLKSLNQLLGQNLASAKSDKEIANLNIALNSLLKSKEQNAKEKTVKITKTKSESRKVLDDAKSDYDKAKERAESTYNQIKQKSDKAGLDFAKLYQANINQQTLGKTKEDIISEITNEINLLHKNERPAGEKFRQIAGHWEMPQHPPQDKRAEHGPCYWIASPNLNSGHNQECLRKVKNLNEKLKALKEIANDLNQLRTEEDSKANAKQAYDQAEKNYKATEELISAKEKLDSEISEIQTSISLLTEQSKKAQECNNAEINSQTAIESAKAKQAEILKTQEELTQKQNELESLLKQSEQIKLKLDSVEKEHVVANTEFQAGLNSFNEANQGLDKIKVEHHKAKDHYEYLSGICSWNGYTKEGDINDGYIYTN